MDNKYQIHNLYGDVAVISPRDRVGAYIDRELETFRSDDNSASFCIWVSPLADLGGELRQVSELQGIQYCIHTPTQERYAGYRGTYWQFDELGDSLIHVYYTPDSSLGWTWTAVEQWLKIVFLQKKWMVVHSCAFIYKSVPVVIVGWQGLGKSVFLHHAMARGAAYVSDDFTLVSTSGEVRGYPPAVTDVHENILRQTATTSRRMKNGGLGRFTHAVAGLPVLNWTIRAITSGKVSGTTPSRTMRMDALHPGLKVTLQTSGVLWVILLPETNGPKETYNDLPLPETVERIVAATMTDYYFTGQYDRFLYQSGHKARNDHLILDARNMYRDILLAALNEARGIWLTDAPTALLNPDILLTRIQETLE